MSESKLTVVTAVGSDATGLVNGVTEQIHDAGANIERIDIEERDARLSIVNLILSVRNRVHLARIIKRLRNLSHVGRITRLGN